MSRDRLARRLRRDVADVRVRLEEAVLRSDALLAAGHPEAAAAVLDEQQELLAELHRTVASSVAAAAVEAEAESVLAGSADGAGLLGGHATERPTPPRRGLRSTASALASAVAAFALLIVAAPAPSPDALPAVEPGDVADGARPGVDAQQQPVDDGTAGLAGNDAATGSADERAIGPNELEVRRLFTSPSPLPRDRSVAIGVGLSGLQALVDSFLASVVRAAGELAPSLEPTSADPPPPAERTLPRLDDRPAPTTADDASVPSADAADRSAGTADREPAAGDGEQVPSDGSSEQEGFPLPSADRDASTPGLPTLD